MIPFDRVDRHVMSLLRKWTQLRQEKLVVSRKKGGKTNEERVEIEEDEKYQKFEKQWTESDAFYLQKDSEKLKKIPRLQENTHYRFGFVIQ